MVSEIKARANSQCGEEEEPEEKQRAGTQPLIPDPRNCADSRECPYRPVRSYHFTRAAQQKRGNVAEAN